jgi:hypothetical protein
MSPTWERILASARKVASYQGDAGMPHPELMAALEKGKTLYTIRLKHNPVLERRRFLTGINLCFKPGCEPWPAAIRINDAAQARPVLSPL